MLSMIRKHWGKFALALTSFFWTACGSNSDSGNNGECPVCEYGVLVDYSSSSAELSSSSVESSSSDIPMSQPLYGVPVATDCYTTTVKSTTGSSYNIFECDNGNRYLKDYFAYSEHLKESLPEDILWNSPNRDNGEGVNCNFNGPHLCVDKMDDEGNMYGGCVPTIECPYKEEK